MVSGPHTSSAGVWVVPWVRELRTLMLQGLAKKKKKKCILKKSLVAITDCSYLHQAQPGVRADSQHSSSVTGTRKE